MVPKVVSWLSNAAKTFAAVRVPVVSVDEVVVDDEVVEELDESDEELSELTLTDAAEVWCVRW